MDGKEAQPSASSSSNLHRACRQFEFHEIRLATQNFDRSLVVGRGGFGKVYKGTVFDGSTRVDAAIKRLSSRSNQGAAEFWAEVEMLSKLRHSHLVSFIGYCSHKKEMILVYEYMSHGTLEDHLHKFRTPLSWLLRLRICLGAAQGLEYLHTGTEIESGIIHRDVKSSNILLDECWEAKISDFGLSRIGSTNQTSSYVETHVKGTFGYLDPDYFATGRLTKKSDVYAFGVVMLQVLCRKRAVDSSLDEDQWGLAAWAQDRIKEGKVKQIIDPDISGQISTKCLRMFVGIATRCLHIHPKKRPTMSEVVDSLESFLALQQEKITYPSQPAGRTMVGRMLQMIPFNGGNFGKKNHCGTTIFSSQIKAKELAFLEQDNRVASLKIIGKGSLGEVYKVDLPEGKVKTIAISMITQPAKPATELIKDDGRFLSKKMRQIKWEIQTAGQIRHRNLLPLLAHVSRPNFHYLVYEFMKNGSLLDILQELGWLARYRVAVGVAKGLEYLHMSHTPRIVHLDIKPANVLLDDDMEARITNFGLANSIPDSDTCMECSNVMGTLGYIAPEFHQTLKITEKCDIYSFGILLAVLVIGKLPSDEFFQHTDEMSLVRWMRKVLTSEDPKQAIDLNLMGNGYEEQMLLVLKIASYCSLDNPKERPNSKDARCMLEQINH